MTRFALALLCVLGCNEDPTPPAPPPAPPPAKLPRTGNRWRDAALAIGEDVLARAHEGAYWTIRAETSPGQWQDQALPDVYSGNAGVLLFLAELSRETGARELDDWLSRGVRWLDRA